MDPESAGMTHFVVQNKYVARTDWTSHDGSCQAAGIKCVCA